MAAANTNNEDKTNLIVNYLPFNMKQEEMEELFSKIGTIESCKLIWNKDSGHGLGYGFVKYCKPEDAARAIDILNGLRLENKTLKVSYARPRSDAIRGANLYVSGLPRSMPVDEIERLFANYGTVINARLLRGIQSPSRGVAFVRLDTREQAERAQAALHGSTLPGGTGPLTVRLVPGYRLPRPPTRRSATSIFVYNLADNVQERDLWQLFGPFGAVQSVNVLHQRGYGFVTMANHGQALSAIRSLNGLQFYNRKLQVSLKRDPNFSMSM